ncbi:FAD/NAD(P)-binding domain-containing protein [Polyplosphaeria fusca]|uniref:FAD/NAD(P)-binding domain-containing protein n=1 Tax=Polyplosphaeria fusca TaxID=682080 RepID=A0A9P4R061_9PLEO|nr:FAD/NAD(P)-binding domain-containing protein [Polyplosphaeria fusca]
MKFLRVLLPLSAAQLVVSARAPCAASKEIANKTNIYDYVVTGSGPGGGTIAVNLARAGHSVLLIEAGGDESDDIFSQILSLGQMSLSPSLSWSFYVKHDDDLERAKRYNLMVWRLKNGELWVGQDPAVEGHRDAERLGVYYPRGATLGGSAIVNAAATFLPSNSDWDYFDKGVGDGIWSGKEMRRVFEKIEHNNYLEAGTPGHGFNGWLQTIIADRSVYPSASPRLKILQAALRLLGKDPSKVIDYLVTDPNNLDPNRDKEEGLFALPFHGTRTWKRFSPRDRILATRNETSTNGTLKYPLNLQLQSLTTKVLFDTCGDKPKAIGVEYLEGASMYKGDTRYNATMGKIGQAFARKEVIVAGGTFNSPQILQLSGVGPRELLQKHNITVVADLPGVGRNLQDNYEMPVVGLAKTAMADPVDPSEPNCTFGAPRDPCVDAWKKGEGPYARAGGNGLCMLLKTNHSADGERDVLMFSTPGGAFRGFKPNTNQNFGMPPETASWSTVKMHPHNTAGFVQIRSSNPRDTPEINFMYFAEGAETDMGAILDTVSFGRRSFFGTETPVGPVESREPPCPKGDIGDDGYCRDSAPDTQWIQDQVFGHHPTSTCSVGPDSNPLAVLDTRLRVRGVQRLRVVDASAFPRIPGAFPAVSTFMLSEKASQLVLEDARDLCSVPSASTATCVSPSQSHTHVAPCGPRMPLERLERQPQRERASPCCHGWRWPGSTFLMCLLRVSFLFRQGRNRLSEVAVERQDIELVLALLKTNPMPSANSTTRPIRDRHAREADEWASTELDGNHAASCALASACRPAEVRSRTLSDNSEAEPEIAGRTSSLASKQANFKASVTTCPAEERLRLLAHVLQNWTVLVAFIGGTSLSIMEIYGVAVNGFAVPLNATFLAERQSERLILVQHMEYAFVIIGIFSVGMIKLSVSLLYWHIFSPVRFRKCLMVWIAVIIAWTITFVLGELLECGVHPLKVFGTVKDLDTYCKHRHGIGYALKASDIATDLGTLLIPLPLIFQMRLPAVKKCLVTLTFLLGALAVGASVASAYIYISSTLKLSHEDGIILVTAYSIWNLVEVHVGIIAACGMTLRPILVRIFPTEHFVILCYSWRPHSSRKTSDRAQVFPSFVNPESDRSFSNNDTVRGESQKEEYPGQRMNFETSAIPEVV